MRYFVRVSPVGAAAVRHDHKRGEPLPLASAQEVCYALLVSAARKHVVQKRFMPSAAAASLLNKGCAESQIMQISEAPMYKICCLWITALKRTKKRGHLFVKQFFSE